MRKSTQALAKPSHSLNRRMSVMCTLIKNRFFQPFHLIKHSVCYSKVTQKETTSLPGNGTCTSWPVFEGSLSPDVLSSAPSWSVVSGLWFRMSQGWWLSARSSLGPGRLELDLTPRPASGKMYTQRKHTDYYLQTSAHSINFPSLGHMFPPAGGSLFCHILPPRIFPK